jgi:hypothetical protein
VSPAQSARGTGPREATAVLADGQKMVTRAQADPSAVLTLGIRAGVLPRDAASVGHSPKVGR